MNCLRSAGFYSTLFLLGCLPVLLKAQQFNYALSSGTASYQELSSPAILNTGNSAWHFSYKIPIGFTCSFPGHSFDSLTIETNGYLVFDADRNYGFTAFNAFGDGVDSSGNHAVLGYALSGPAGNHTLKIQFKNVCLNHSAAQQLSYQIWLKESGDIEVHIGPNAFQPDPEDSLSVLDTSLYQRVGLLNMNMDTNPSGYFAGGGLSQPSGQPLNDTHPDFIYLHGMPAPGTRYTFSVSNP